MATRRPPARSAGALGAAALIAVGLAAYTPLTGALARRADASAPQDRADAIVVLGAGVEPDGLLDEHSLRRVIDGVLLYRRGLARRLVVLGPAYEGSPMEAAVRARLV